MKPFPVQVDLSTFLHSAPNTSANMLTLHHISVIVKQDHGFSTNKGVIVKHAFFLLFSSLHSLHCHSLSLSFSLLFSVFQKAQWQCQQTTHVSYSCANSLRKREKKGKNNLSGSMRKGVCGRILTCAKWCKGTLKAKCPYYTYMLQDVCQSLAVITHSIETQQKTFSISDKQLVLAQFLKA